MDKDQVVARLNAHRQTWTLDEFCAAIERTTGRKISFQYLQKMLSGKRKPGKAVLDYLGLERVVVYREKSWKSRKGRPVR